MAVGDGEPEAAGLRGGDHGLTGRDMQEIVSAS
jgi:hypothetical protein